jgi:hypothetical protein
LPRRRIVSSIADEEDLRVMASPRKPMTTAVVATLCLAWLGSVAAVAHGVSRGSHPREAGGSELAACSSSGCGSGGQAPAAVDESARAKDVLYVPSTIIAAPWPERTAGSTRAPLAVDPGNSSVATSGDGAKDATESAGVLVMPQDWLVGHDPASAGAALMQKP